jgi:UDP-4-amino-4,6-dideoxy-N-acetyl-beta-L-altrosamine transaminase
MTDFLPYARQLVEDDDIRAVVEVLRSDFLTTGPRVAAFETALADSVEAEWAVAVGSGTAALHAACFAAGVQEGDEVIVPAITFVATANCVRYLGGEPVFADVDPDTGLVVPESVADRAGPATRAIMAVHLAGACADMQALSPIAKGAGAVLIEDAAHALGGSYGGRRVGSGADGSSLSIFSFHPVKHITTGEGGAITGNDGDLRRTLRLFRDHGIERTPRRFREQSPGPWYYEQQILGHNLRLTDIQAALGLSQLAKLTRFVERRRALAARYDRLLADLPAVTPVVGDATRAGCAYHLYPVLIDFGALETTRAAVMRRLRERGIGTQVHYIPLPMQPYYRDRGSDPAAFPGALRYYERTLSLPLFPAMRDEDVDRVVDGLGVVLGGAGVKG